MCIRDSRSPYGSKGDMHGAAEATFKQQDELLERSVALARQFKTCLLYTSPP